MVGEARHRIHTPEELVQNLQLRINLIPGRIEEVRTALDGIRRTSRFPDEIEEAELNARKVIREIYETGAELEGQILSIEARAGRQLKSNTIG